MNPLPVSLAAPVGLLSILKAACPGGTPCLCLYGPWVKMLLNTEGGLSRLKSSLYKLIWFEASHLPNYC